MNCEEKASVNLSHVILLSKASLNIWTADVQSHGNTFKQNVAENGELLWSRYIKRHRSHILQLKPLVLLQTLTLKTKKWQCCLSPPLNSTYI